VKARVFRLQSDEHEAVQSVLPWYANGTLALSEAQRVRDHLAQCAGCRADAAWQERVRAAAPDPLPAVAQREVDRQWSALAQRITDEGAAPARRPVAAREPVRAPWWPLAFGLQTALVAVLAIVWFAAPPRDGAFHALGAPAAGATANVLVVFRPNATEADIRRALRASHAQLVGGPTVTDAYLLHVEPMSSDVLARLRGNGVFQRVDSLQAQAR